MELLTRDRQQLLFNIPVMNYCHCVVLQDLGSRPKPAEVYSDMSGTIVSLEILGGGCTGGIVPQVAQQQVGASGPRSVLNTLPTIGVNGECEEGPTSCY